MEEDVEPETEESNQEPETDQLEPTEAEQPESTETGQEAIEEAPEVVEIEEAPIDDLDPIKPHSDIQSDDAGNIIDSNPIITPDDAIVVSPSGPLTTKKP